MSKNKLEQLKKFTVIVADTGDIDAIKQHQPQDATTNPSLIYQAAQKPQYSHLIEEAVQFAASQARSPREQWELTLDRCTVNFGKEILDVIPGRVSTEVNARLSFDTQASIKKARQLIKLYEDMGIPRERILIKLAATWEGIRAAEELERESIHCNLTLMFSLPQAIACADAGVTLISPFVGRIMDWYKKHEGVDAYAPAEDPGVQSVTQIYNYYKKFGYKTEVMGASFRNTDEILELAGCDLLTISPQLLEQLSQAEGSVSQRLSAENAAEVEIKEQSFDEEQFRLSLNECAMATEKLAEGIRNFYADYERLSTLIRKNYSQPQASV